MIFALPREKKTLLLLISHGYSEDFGAAKVWPGGGRELVLWAEFVNLISHRKEI